ncbi:hypothetical protein ACLOJK_036957 [Asimina triloba]
MPAAVRRSGGRRHYLPVMPRHPKAAARCLLPPAVELPSALELLPAVCFHPPWSYLLPAGSSLTPSSPPRCHHRWRSRTLPLADRLTIVRALLATTLPSTHAVVVPLVVVAVDGAGDEGDMAARSLPLAHRPLAALLVPGTGEDARSWPNFHRFFGGFQI